MNGATVVGKEESMKILKKLALASSVFITLSMSATAAHKNQTDFSLNESAQLGSTLLSPGEYSLSWSGTGNDGTVTISRGKTVLVSVPAKLVEQRSAYSRPAVSTSTEGGSVHITEIQLPRLDMLFNVEKETSMQPSMR